MTPTHQKAMMVVFHELKFWKHYLIGAKFAIFTDRQSLKYFPTQPKVFEKHLRWLNHLAHFTSLLSILQINMLHNVVANTLCKQPQIHAIRQLITSLLLCQVYTTKMTISGSFEKDYKRRTPFLHMLIQMAFYWCGIVYAWWRNWEEKSRKSAMLHLSWGPKDPGYSTNYTKSLLLAKDKKGYREVYFSMFVLSKSKSWYDISKQVCYSHYRFQMHLKKVSVLILFLACLVLVWAWWFVDFGQVLTIFASNFNLYQWRKLGIPSKCPDSLFDTFSKTMVCHDPLNLQTQTFKLRVSFGEPYFITQKQS